MLVTEAVGGPIELPDVQRARLRASEAARHDDAIAGLERSARHPDVGELEPIVHLEPPRLAAALGVDRDDDERVRVDELEFRDDALDALLARAVVDGADRVVRRRREARAREHPRRHEAGPVQRVPAAVSLAACARHAGHRNPLSRAAAHAASAIGRPPTPGVG